MKLRAKIISIVTTPVITIVPRMKLMHIMVPCVHMRIVRLSNLSETTPVNGVKSSDGICERNTATESMNTESVMLYTSQPIATC